MAPKRYLFTPGPTTVPPEVLAAMAEPVVHHRSPDFRAIYSECLQRLKQVFRTSSDVLLFTASGTGAMESAVANLCSPGNRVVVVSAGSYGDPNAEYRTRLETFQKVVSYGGVAGDPAYFRVWTKAGLILEFGGRRGLLLPQVATEWEFDRTTFLGELSRKAGLPPETWRQPGAKLWSFQAEVFSEEERGRE